MKKHGSLKPYLSTRLKPRGVEQQLFVVKGQ